MARRDCCARGICRICDRKQKMDDARRAGTNHKLQEIRDGGLSKLRCPSALGLCIPIPLPPPGPLLAANWVNCFWALRKGSSRSEVCRVERGMEGSMYVPPVHYLRSVCQQQASKRAAGIIKILQSPRPLVAVIVHQSPYKISAIASWWG